MEDVLDGGEKENSMSVCLNTREDFRPSEWRCKELGRPFLQQNHWIGENCNNCLESVEIVLKASSKYRKIFFKKISQ